MPQTGGPMDPGNILSLLLARTSELEAGVMRLEEQENIQMRNKKYLTAKMEDLEKQVDKRNSILGVPKRPHHSGTPSSKFPALNPTSPPLPSYMHGSTIAHDRFSCAPQTSSTVPYPFLQIPTMHSRTKNSALDTFASQRSILPSGREVASHSRNNDSWGDTSSTHNDSFPPSNQFPSVSGDVLRVPLFTHGARSTRHDMLSNLAQFPSQFAQHTTVASEDSEHMTSSLSTRSRYDGAHHTVKAESDSEAPIFPYPQAKPTKKLQKTQRRVTEDDLQNMASFLATYPTAKTDARQIDKWNRFSAMHPERTPTGWQCVYQKYGKDILALLGMTA